MAYTGKSKCAVYNHLKRLRLTSVLGVTKKFRLGWDIMFAYPPMHQIFDAIGTTAVGIGENNSLVN